MAVSEGRLKGFPHPSKNPLTLISPVGNLLKYPLISDKLDLMRGTK